MDVRDEHEKRAAAGFGVLFLQRRIAAMPSEEFRVLVESLPRLKWFDHTKEPLK